MRILHAISSLNPAIGGPPVVAINLAKAQTTLGHDVGIAAEDIPVDVDVPTLRLPRQSLRTIFAHPIAEIVSAVRNADVCHLHGVWEPLLLQVARAARQLHRHYVVTPHGMLDPWSLQQKKLKKRMALALGFRTMLNRSALIHALNADEKRLLEPLGLTAPCAIIPNGMFLEELEPPPNPSLFRSSRGNRPYILFLSRLHYKKGLDVLVDAFAQIAHQHLDIDLVIAGPDDGEQNSVVTRAKDHGLNERIFLVGPLYGAMKWSALSGATCFCLPSRQEGFSIAILEAMACRTPVVISDQCHFPEVAETGAGLIVPVRADAVATALQKVLSDPERGQQMGRAGRELVERRFTWNRVAERCLEHYERLVSAQPVA